MVIVFPPGEVDPDLLYPCLTTSLPLKKLASLHSSWMKSCVLAVLQLKKFLIQTRLSPLWSKSILFSMLQRIDIHSLYTCTYSDIALVFHPLPGALMDDDYLYPPSDLFNISGFPIRPSSMIHHGQLPPLNDPMTTPYPTSSTVLSAGAGGSLLQPLTSLSSPIEDAWQTAVQDGKEQHIQNYCFLDSTLTYVVCFLVDVASITEPAAPVSDKKDKKKKQKLSKKKQSSKTDDDSILDKIPTVKEWAKQQEKKRKAEEKKEKEELKKEKKKQKELEKKQAVANKKIEAEKRKKEKESKKAEKKAAKVKSAKDKAEKAATKAAEKKKEQREQLAIRLQQVLEDSDRQMAYDLAWKDRLLLEQKRRCEEKAKKLMAKNKKTVKTINLLKEKLDRKERKVLALRAHRDSCVCHNSTLAAYKLNYEIDNCYRRIFKIRKVIGKLEKKVAAKIHEVKMLAPYLLETEVESEASVVATDTVQTDSDSAEPETAANDDCSVLEMLCCLESDDEDDDELSS